MAGMLATSSVICIFLMVELLFYIRSYIEVYLFPSVSRSDEAAAALMTHCLHSPMYCFTFMFKRNTTITGGIFGLSSLYLLQDSSTQFSILPGAPFYAINNSGRIKDSVIYSSHDSNSLFCHSQIDLRGKCWLIVTIVPAVQIQPQRNPDKSFPPFVFRQDISPKLFKFSKTMDPINAQRAGMWAWKGERVCVANAACRKCYYINGLCKTKTLILS